MAIDEQVIRVGVAVVQWHGAFLVGVRDDTKVLAGLAEFPGGKQRDGESAIECAVRECLEETQLVVNPIRVHSCVTHRYAHGLIELTFVLCEPANEKSAPGHGFRWVPRKELAQLNFPAANHALIEQLREETQSL